MFTSSRLENQTAKVEAGGGGLYPKKCLFWKKESSFFPKKCSLERSSMTQKHGTDSTAENKANMLGTPCVKNVSGTL